MEPIEIATKLFSEDFNCAQSVFTAFAGQLELPSETALKLASPFGAGIGRLGSTCGAVSGALLVIGLKFGYTDPLDKETKEKTYRLAREFIQQFTTRWASIRCQELIGYDISNPTDLQEAHDKQVFSTVCPGFVRAAVEILNSLS